MATDIQEICNRAIGNMGGELLTAAPASDSDQTESILCDLYYDPARQTVLKEYPWHFARKWESLSDHSAYTTLLDTGDEVDDSRWAYAYSLPSDFLKLVRFEYGKDIPYEIRSNNTDDGLVLVCNEDDPVIEFIWDIETTTLFPEHFTRALIALLRVELSGTIETKANKQINWSASYNHVLAWAKETDALINKKSRLDSQGHDETTCTWYRAATGGLVPRRFWPPDLT